MKRLFTMALLAGLLSNPLFAKCVQSDAKSTTISWKAYKTPLKVGVGGKFTKMTLSKSVKGSSVKDAIYGLGAIIDLSSSSIQTGNEPRDKKIAKFFFGSVKGGSKIKARVTSIDDKVLKLNISLNGVSKEIPLTYTILGNELKAVGHIDVLDFKMNSALASLNKACYALHEGKTWSDVQIELTSQFRACK